MIDIDRIQKKHAPTTSSFTNAQLPKSSFQRTMAQSMQVGSQQTIVHLIKELTKDGERLAKRRSSADLLAFKRGVQACLHHFVAEGLNLKQESSTASGRLKQYQLVELIEEELTQLTKDVFNQRKTELDLLDRIGELKGLIIKIYI
ncbi:YaaR family protein [Bacillus sp. JCM 19041]|uniref:YaaR family protein n=1 Tax=Bacillus sp. JCM 19041 TaxID=1460637 RepID=UPI0006D24190